MTAIMLALLGSGSSPSSEVFLTGVGASGAVGFVGSQGSVTFEVAGVSASGQVGTVGQSLGCSVTVTGVAATGAVGTAEAQPAQLPEGAILLFDRETTGTAIPSGFSLYTEENGESVTGFLIKGGSAVSRDTGTSAPVSYTGSPVTSSTDGAHGAGVSPFPSRSGQFSPSPSSFTTDYAGTAGGHSHTISFSGSATYPESATIQGTNVPLIRASSVRNTIPQNAIVFSVSTGFTGFSSKSWATNGVYSIASSVISFNSSPTSVSPSFSLSTSSNGAHTHGRPISNSQLGPSTPLSWTDASGFEGNHTHPGGSFGTIGVWKQYKNLLPFVATEDSEVQSGMVIMYNGVSVPPGWKLCDGTSGTPNMVGYFLGFNSGSSGDTLVGRDVIGSSGPTATTPAPPPSAYGTTSVPVTLNPSPWSHSHTVAKTTSNHPSVAEWFHGTAPVTHTHTVPSATFTMPSAYMPRNLTLIFIQKE